MQRYKLIEEILDYYFPDPKIQLNYINNYTLLIAVLMSAQASDKKVNEITDILFKKAKTAKEMIQLSVLEIEKIIKPIGIYRKKAKAIKDLSQLLIEKHKGEVPNTLSLLKKLPGVGNKTASVVLCTAFKTPAFPVDRHVQRCSNRWGLTTEAAPHKIEIDLKKTFSRNEWAKRHLQIILFGRKFCTAKKHNILKCPICKKIIIPILVRKFIIGLKILLLNKVRRLKLTT